MVSPDWYPYPYNYSNGTAVNGIGSWWQYSNVVLGDWMGAGIILLIWLATFGMSLVVGVRKAMLTASFISFVFSIYLVRLGMIHPVIVVTLIILTIVGAIGGKEDTGL